MRLKPIFSSEIKENCENQEGLSHNMKIIIYGAIIAGIISISAHKINYNTNEGEKNRGNTGQKAELDDWIIQKLLRQFETEYYNPNVTRTCRIENRAAEIAELKSKINSNYPTARGLTTNKQLHRKYC